MFVQLVAIIRRPRSPIYYSSRLIYASTLFSMLASHLHPSFLDKLILSTSSLMPGLMHGHSLSCTLVHFFKFFLSSLQKWSRVSFRGRAAQVFIPLINFLLYTFVSSSFLVLLKYSSLIFFFHLRLFDGVSIQYSQILVHFHFCNWSDFS